MSAVIDLVQHCVRPMRRTDISGVRRIEVACYQFPWSEREIEEVCFRHSLRWRGGSRASLALRHSWVLAEGGSLVSHAIMTVEDRGAHIMNLCVHPRRQGRGLGRQMLDNLLRVARMGAARHAYLEVRPTNIRAQRLYIGAGFRKVGLCRDFYPTLDGREDAWVLTRQLGERQDA